jgi:hypothetical protein
MLPPRAIASAAAAAAAAAAQQNKTWHEMRATVVTDLTCNLDGKACNGSLPSQEAHVLAKADSFLVYRNNTFWFHEKFQKQRVL